MLCELRTAWILFFFEINACDPVPAPQFGRWYNGKGTAVGVVPLTQPDGFVPEKF